MYLRLLIVQLLGHILLETLGAPLEERSLRKHMPEYEEYAKRVPAWIPKIRRQRKKVSKISLELVGAAIWFGLPILFVLDATMLRLGLLYSPYLSFFNSLDTYIQVWGWLLRQPVS